MVAFTGERVHADDDAFRFDLHRHLAAYCACEELVPGKVVLDVGCGDAGGAGRLARSARAVIGVDRSREVIREASRHRPKNLSLSCGDAGALSFRDASFDLVCCFQVIEHLHRPEALLREAARVLRPGGALMLTTPNRLTSFSENPYHVREYEPDELRRLVAPWFSSVEIAGIFGNERVRTLDRARRRHVEAILALDPLRLRRVLPRSLQERAFAVLARWVRARMRSQHRESFAATTHADYVVGRDGVESSLDLLAICKK